MAAKGKRRRRKKNLKPVFEARKHHDPELPEGFTENLGGVTQEEAYATISQRLDLARQSLPDGFQGKVLMQAYDDGSVDGELYVKVPQGHHQGEAAWALHGALGQTNIGRQYWASVGARFSVPESADEATMAGYKAYRGLRFAQSNYQRAISANLAEEDLILRKMILPGMKDAFEEEAHSVFIRVHWNPEGKQPQR